MDGDGWSRIERDAAELRGTLALSKASGTMTIVVRFENGIVRYGELSFTKRLQLTERAERAPRPVEADPAEILVSVVDSRKSKGDA